MNKKILVIDETGISWKEAPTLEASLHSAEDTIGEYVSHKEDNKNPEVFRRYVDFLKQIDLTLIKIDIASKEDQKAFASAWVNHIWTLKPDEQRLLFKKWGVPMKNMGILMQK